MMCNFLNFSLVANDSLNSLLKLWKIVPFLQHGSMFEVFKFNNICNFFLLLHFGLFLKKVF